MSSEPLEEKTQDKPVLPFSNSNLPHSVLKKSVDELCETSEGKETGLLELTKNLKGNSKTNAIEFERDFLIHYLRVNKYNVQKSFKQIQNYVDLWNKEEFLFQSVPDEYFLSKGSTRFAALLPERCPDGCPVILFQIGKWDPSEMAFTDILKLIATIHLQLLRDPMTQISGIKTVYDFKGTSFQHLRNILNDKLYLINHIPMPLRFLDKFEMSVNVQEWTLGISKCMDEFRHLFTWESQHFQLIHSELHCIPARHKDVHIINETVVLRTMWKFVKQFLSQKLRKRVHFHSDPKRLRDYFPASMLPVEYGGEIPDINSLGWIRRMNKEQENFTIGGQPNFYGNGF